MLQNLLEEGVHIRDTRTIIDTLAEHAARVQDPFELTALVRIALGRAIVQQIFPQGAELRVMALDATLERLLTQAMQTGAADGAGIEPGLADTLVKEADQASRTQENIGLPSVLLVPAQLRTLLARFLGRAVPRLKILSHAEIPDNSNIKVISILGARA